MNNFRVNDPEVERSAPTVSAENVEDNKLITVCLRNAEGDPIYEIGYLSRARTKKYMFFGPLVITYNGWKSIDTNDFEEVCTYLDLFVARRYDEIDRDFM